MNIEKLSYAVGRLQEQLIVMQNTINSLRKDIIEIKIDISNSQTDEAKMIYENEFTVIDRLAKARYEDGQRQFANWDQTKWEQLSDGRRFNESKHMLAAIKKLHEIICRLPSKYASKQSGDAVTTSVWIERYIGEHEQKHDR